MSIELHKNWEPQKFNKNFDEYIQQVKQKNKEEEDNINKLNEKITEKQIYDYTIYEFLYNWKQ